MAEFLAAIRFPGAGTFFCTQRYQCLEEGGHEIAPHPFLGEGSVWEDELCRMRALFPEATGWRSHSCVFSHLLMEWVGENGYHYVSTNDEVGRRGPRPFRHPWGVWQLPIYYMDNMDFSTPHYWPELGHSKFDPALVERALEDDGVYVFDFHPIHLLLNTEGKDHYFAVRQRFLEGEDVAVLRSLNYGTASFFTELTEAMEARGVASVRMSDALSVCVAEDFGT